jgi:predicted Zn-dependent protease
MATLEQIIDEARALSPAEKGKLRQALDRELEQQAPAQSSKPGYPTNEQERAWINAHRDEYLGQWVALDGDHLVAHGTDARTVYEAARAQGVEIPYIDRVEPKVDAFMGGWQ